MQRTGGVRVAAEAVPAGVLAITRDGRIAGANARAERLLGYAPGELIGRPVEELAPERLRAACVALLERFVASPSLLEPPRGRELFARRKDGSEVAVELSLSHDGQGYGLVVHVLMVDLSERRRHERAIRHHSVHDALTGLPNRVLLDERLGRAFATAAARGGKGTVAALFLDVDQFKVVNDSLGHQAGDALLREVAERLRARVRPGDTVARFGGDEFVVLCEGLGVPNDALGVVARIEDAFAAPFIVDGRPHRVSASIGVATSGPTTADPDTLLRNADVAMYRAKARGRARYEIFDEQLHARSLRAFELQRALPGAIERGELRLEYQPVYRMEDGLLDAFEALARWRHNGVDIPPAEFIPLAERAGLISMLGEWVLREAVRQLAVWRPLYPTLRVAVNLSARQLTDDTLVGTIIAVLDETGADPAGLALEVTETALLEDQADALSVIEAVRALGCSVLLDDFGTGYSSLAHVARFPVDGIKIDRQFVAGCDTEPASRAVVDAIVGLAGGLGACVVAEGVETASQHAEVTQAGCGFAQGYRFARALPREQAAELVRRGDRV